jgi:uroporphyrinogen-III synthase
LAALLTARGHQVELEPVFEVVERPDGAIDLTGVQAILFTSANGVRAFCAALPKDSGEVFSRPVFAVGDATARTAADLGFSAIESAGGDVVDLTALVIRRLDPADGCLFHAAGSKAAGDLKGGLETAGFRFRRGVLYETRAIEALSSGTQALLRGGQIDAVAFFSPRTAGCFVRLIVAAGLEAALETVTAVCLSAAVKHKLEPLRWKAVLVAPAPTQDALLAVFDR